MRTVADQLISVHPIVAEDLPRTQSALRVLAAWTVSPYLGLRGVVDQSCTFSTLVRDDCAVSNLKSLSTLGLRNPELASSRLAEEITTRGKPASIRSEGALKLSLLDTYLVGPYGVLSPKDLEIFEDLLRDQSSKYCIHLKVAGPIHTKLSSLCAWLISRAVVSPSLTFSRKFPKAVSIARSDTNGTFRLMDIHTLLPTTRGLNMRSDALRNAPNVCVAQSLLPHVGLALPELQPFMAPIVNNLTWIVSGQSENYLPRVTVLKSDVNALLYPIIERIGKPLVPLAVFAVNIWARFLTSVLSLIYNNSRLVELALNISRKYPRLTKILRKIVRSGESKSHNPYLRRSEISYLSEAFDLRDVAS